MAVITVVGAGMMGSAIAIPAGQNGNEIRLVGTHLDRSIIDHARRTGEHLTMKRTLPHDFTFYHFEELDEALQRTNLVVCGVSSFGVDWFSDKVIPRIPEGIPILSVTKGMHLTEGGDLVPFPVYFREKHPERRGSYNAVGGPCTSYELADGDQTEVCFCGTDPAELAKLRALFETSYYHVSTSTDVVGVEIAVAMKNAYALAVCLAVGHSKRQNPDGHENYNSQAALFGQSVREIRRLLHQFGGADDNIVYASGDLYVTIFGGRTRRIGTLLGEGMSLEDALAELKGVTLESLVIAERTVRAVRWQIESGKAREEDYPLLLYVGEILALGTAGPVPWNAFETHAHPAREPEKEASRT